jgi:hypothetical protein
LIWAGEEQGGDGALDDDDLGQAGGTGGWLRERLLVGSAAIWAVALAHGVNRGTDRTVTLYGARASATKTRGFKSDACLRRRE